ncbi:hypothetical protein [Sphingomonas sp.]|uniref:hypothetical protein n=1 Tax=Sphingomonas sp. TaxID=28214 RepID=UPI002CC61F95|nr:hypothetical protein [Sphingomonas sp.]HTG38801.1 hypothetical protein [Sphingomonas sp.]
MDLSFARFERDMRARLVASPVDMLLATAAGRQSATPTARLASQLAYAATGRAHGAFERETARMLLVRREE